MLINPSYYDFLEQIIFDLQITIDIVHPVQSCPVIQITASLLT